MKYASFNVEIKGGTEWMVNLLYSFINTHHNNCIFVVLLHLHYIKLFSLTVNLKVRKSNFYPINAHSGQKQPDKSDKIFQEKA